MAFTSGTAELFKGVDIRARRKFKSPPIADQKAHAETQKKLKEAKKEREDE